jgi:hypothetical protein
MSEINKSLGDNLFFTMIQSIPETFYDRPEAEQITILQKAAKKATFAQLPQILLAFQ